MELLKRRMLSFFETAILPQYQVVVLIATIITLALISTKGLQQQVALEPYPEIKEITHQQYQTWGGEPAIIQTGLQINNFPVFKILEDNFTIVGKLWFLFDPELITLETVKKFSFENQNVLEKTDPEVRLINNMLFAEFNIRLSFTTPLTQRAFPFDTHRLYLNLINTHISPQEAVFVSNNDQFVIGSQVSIPEWTQKKPTVYTGYVEYELDKSDDKKTITYPKALFAINFERSGLRHVFIMLLPLFLICAVGMIAIGAQKTIGGKSLDINVAGAASILAYRFVIESMSPKVSYLMLADYVFIFFLVTACAQLIFSAITYQQPPRDSWIVIRAALCFCLYSGIISLWAFLLFSWAPSYAQKDITPTAHVKIDEKTEFYPDLELEQDKSKPIVRLGFLIDLNRIDRDTGRQIKNGTNARLKKAIKDNELRHFISTEFVDDAAPPVKTGTSLKHYKEEGISMILSAQGSAAIRSYQDSLQKKELLMLFPITGASTIRTAQLSNVINFRPSFTQESSALTHYAVDTIGVHKVAILYEDSTFGIEMLETARTILKTKTNPGISITEIPYEVYGISLEKQIQEIKRSDADAIFFFSSGTATIECIHQIGVEHLVNRTLIGTSYLNQAHVNAIINEKGLHFITSNVVPSPKKSSLQIAQEFRAAAVDADVGVGTFSFESYINMEILLLLLSKIDGEVTHEKIIKQAEALKNYNHKGLILNFDTTTRELSKTIWIETLQNDWIEIKG